MAFLWSFTLSTNNTTMAPDTMTASHGQWRWKGGNTGELWSEKRLSPAFLQRTMVQRGKPREANVSKLWVPAGNTHIHERKLMWLWEGDGKPHFQGEDENRISVECKGSWDLQ